MHRSQRVLIFDFDSKFLINLKRALENAGFDSSVTSDSKQALEAVTAGQFDFFVTRGNPQQLEMVRLLDEMRRGRANCRCIVLDRLDEFRNLIEQLRHDAELSTHCATCGVDLHWETSRRCEFCHRAHCAKCADCHLPECDERLGPIARMLGY